MTLADLIQLRDALERARFAGTLKVKSGDDEITYRSDAEMKAALDALGVRIKSATGTNSVRQVRIASSKGL